MSKENKHPIRQFFVNFLHICIIVGLLIYTFYSIIADGGVTAQNFWGGLLNCLLAARISDIFTFIGAIAFILFGVVSIYEFAYTNGLRWLLPSPYLNFRVSRDEKTARIMMKTYYKQDIDFIQEYEQERVNRVLQALGIQEEQFHHIQYEIVRARSMAYTTPKDMENKLKAQILRKSFIVDQSEVPKENRIYPNVNYYLNLCAAFYDTQLCADVSKILVANITWDLKQNLNVSLDAIDYIVIPHSSNLLLGLETGKLLGKHVIAMQHSPRIQKDIPWDGIYQTKKDGTNNIIVIHDVLVSGTCIYKSVDLLPRGSYTVLGVYCLAHYFHRDYTPYVKLSDHNITHIKCLTKIDEGCLKQILDGEEQ